MEILILGGGVVGVTTAYQLLKDGHQVKVIDRQAPGIGGASYGNAGLIATGHSIAWGSPKALKIWFNSFFQEDPVFRMKFQTDSQFIGWGLKFLAQCTEYKAKRNSLAKHRICVYSQKKLQEVVAETKFKYAQNTNGLLYLYRNQQAMAANNSHIRLLQEVGQALEIVDKERVLEIIPEMRDSADQIAGGVFSATDESGDSRIFTEQLMEVCRKMGGTFESGVSIERIEASGTTIKRVVTNCGTYSADSYVLSLGAWSPLLVSASLGVRLSVYPVKGYSITIPVEKGHTPPRIGGLHEEDLLGFAPMGDHFRVSSISEFNGYDAGHTPEDFEHILSTAKKLFPNAGNYEKAEYWSGFRPMTPEGTPILGKGLHSNLFYNTGHGHLGWTMSCGTARITADLIAGKSPEISTALMGVR
ncbi:MAG: FAD-dependent oxidoreductase [SAR324 cluster bacterium]|nr:FAD-dependent oxidoreductase [SAR324 cluster bacterium]MBL7035982.1 FAD-dependent oxidoreductase [SAR324 cluster bacterium]